MTAATQPIAIVAFDIDGVVRDVGNSYRRALADTVEHFTQQIAETAYRPTPAEIDRLKSEGIWNNDWEASQELIGRFATAQGLDRASLGMTLGITYEEIVAFFQSRYRGPDPDRLTGYICDEPLLLDTNYFEQLTQAGILWGFFSGATRKSASFVLSDRIGLTNPVLIAMEDAPGKPDPTGLFETVTQLEMRAGLSQADGLPVIYIGDTVADMYTIIRAIDLRPGDRRWLAVGVLPPHIHEATTDEAREAYRAALKQAGADLVLDRATELNTATIQQLINHA